MKGRMGVVSRWVLLIVLVVSGFAAPVRADVNLPPGQGSVAPPAAPAEYPVYQLQPSPTGRVGRMALDATTSLQVIETPTKEMKVLVILDSVIQIEGEDYPDGINQMMTGYLDILGIPYDVIDVNERTAGSAPLITDAMLWDGVDHGYYYAIFIGNNTVWWPQDPDPGDPLQLQQGLTEDERNLIRAYERNFAVRRVTWYAYPEATQYGLDFVDGTLSPVTVTMTDPGKEVFGYLKPDVTLSLTGGYTYLAAPAAGADFTPLWQADGGGNPVMGIFAPLDAGEHLVVTASAYYPATPPVSLHGRLWPYGIINWATRGIFLGERHLYFVPQPDDVLSFGDRWDPISHTVYYDDGFRLVAEDLDNLVSWMDEFIATVPNAGDFKIEMPFNGEGVLLDLDGTGEIAAGSLSARARDLQDRFVWLNHTYSHENLDSASVELVRTEILSNTEVAERLGFTDYVTDTLLTGAYSGLNNYNLVSTAYDLGIRYILANASQPGYNNPTPNTGLTPYAGQPDLLLVPRLANNIFYFASTPEQEADYYNMVYDAINNVYYCQDYYNNPSPENLCYTYEELLDLITNQALGFLLDFNINATMFHMNNLYAYDAPNSDKTLLGDYVESLYGKYNSYYRENVPILSLRTQEIGQRMWERMDYDASGVSGIIACSNDITLTMPITAPTSVKAPVTGIIYQGENATTETYAGQDITTISMAPGQTLFVPATTAPSPLAAVLATAPDAVTGLSITLNPDGSRLLSWDPAEGVFGYRIYRGSTPETVVEIDVIAGTSYLDSEVTDATTYAVTAIADDCFKEESAPAVVRLAPTSVSLAALSAAPSAVGGSAPVLLALLAGFVVVIGTRRRREPEA